MVFDNMRVESNGQTSVADHSKNFASTVKWMGHRISSIKNKMGITDVVAFILHPLAARCAYFTSSYSFKWRVQTERVQNSRATLMALGGEEVNLPMPDGSRLFGFYLDAQRCMDIMLNKGAQKGTVPYSDDLVQDVLWIPSETGELMQLIDRMNVPVRYHEGSPYICLGVPHPQRQTDTPVEDSTGTVIYAPGSGHLFEFRRKTIGSFLLGYGMNMFVFHYSGTGLSTGSITEQATYNNVEGVFQYLKQTKATQANKILGYGHCVGAGPIIDLASRQPIHLLADRTQLNMGEFAQRRLIKLSRLPKFLHFLLHWIQPVMNKCFCYDNQEKIQHVSGRVAVIQATNDDLIPEGDMSRLFNQAVLSQHKVRLVINSDHDMDLVQDEEARLALGKFLSDAHLINNQPPLPVS